jgi:hypothetical protein
MSMQFQVNGPTPIAIKLTTTNPTVIAGDTERAVTVDWFQCTEIAGGTPNLSIELFDGTTSVYLRKAKPMAALEEVLRTQGFTLNRGQFLRVTASVANQVDVTGVAVLSRAQ